jgi:hypothetical protein
VEAAIYGKQLQKVIMKNTILFIKQGKCHLRSLLTQESSSIGGCINYDDEDCLEIPVVLF